MFCGRPQPNRFTDCIRAKFMDGAAFCRVPVAQETAFCPSGVARAGVHPNANAAAGASTAATSSGVLQEAEILPVDPK